MRRKPTTEEHENHERWLVSYADFITLLFAFFVVMYSVSSINDGKYRVLSASLVRAFSESPMRSLDPIQIGELVGSGNKQQQEAEHVAEEASLAERMADSGLVDGSDSIDPNVMEIDTISEEFLEAFAPFIEDGRIQLRREDDSVELTIKSQILFTSGSARLQGSAVAVLASLADVLGGFDNSIRVAGFTDNQPISTVAFPSNWELSAARAASVVHVLTKLSIAPQRMAAIGYGEHRPIADNRTREGRQKNRRVVISVSATAEKWRVASQEPASQAILQAAPRVPLKRAIAPPVRESFDS